MFIRIITVMGYHVQRERERAYPGKQGVRRTGHTPPAPGS